MTNPKVQALVGFASSIAGLLTLPDFPGRVWVLGGLASVSAGIYARDTLKRIWSQPFICVTVDPTEQENDLSSVLGQRIYSRGTSFAYPPREQTRSWSQKYGHGVFHALDERNKLWAYFSLWPLTQEAFRKLANGTIGESEIDASMIPDEKSAPFIYWYLADIVKDRGSPSELIPSPTFSRHLKDVLISSGLSHLVKLGHIADVVEFVGLAISGPGKQILKEFHFVKVPVNGGGANKPAIFVRTFTKQQLKGVIKKLEQRSARSERTISSLYKPARDAKAEQGADGNPH